MFLGKIRNRLAKKTAAFMSAVLLFTSGADMFAPITEVVAADEADAAQDELTVPQEAAEAVFTLSASELQYGEDGSNERGNLDVIFSPCLKIGDDELIPGEDYSISYKFFTDKEKAEAVDIDNFEEAEGEVLSDIPAGTTVYVLACAQTEDARYPASAELTIQKRKISISYNASEDNAVEGRDVSENGIYIMPEADIDYSAFTIDAADGFAYELDADSLLAGDLYMDLSAVDLSVDSQSDVPMEVQLDPIFDDNYELDKNIHGNLYISKAQYYVVFMAGNNGETYIKKYALPGLDYSATAAELLKKLGKTDEILSKTEEGRYNLAGFIDGENEILTGWSVYADGYNAINNSEYSDYEANTMGTTVNLNPDATTYDSDDVKKEYHLSGKKDYLFVAQISKAAARDLYISVIPAVTYDPREHVAIGTKVNLKKQIPDLRIKVNFANGGTFETVAPYTELRPGTDYTIKYYNNVEASMSVSEDGTYVPVKTGSDRPHAEITGKGNYKGFSAVVYFDILPVNLSETEYGYNYIHDKNDYSDDQFDYGYYDRPYTFTESYIAVLSGLMDSRTYVLKNGKVSGIKLKVAKSFHTFAVDYDGGTQQNTIHVDLVKGKDFVFELYKWNEEGTCWILQEGITDPNQLTSVGHYLVLVRGIGNYCGARFDRYDHQNFYPGVDGNPNPYGYLASEFQFNITDSYVHDLTYASISVGKKTIDYDGLLHNADSFGIVVKDKDKNILEYHKDYEVEFEGVYTKINNYGKTFLVNAANTYKVKVYGIGDYYGDNNIKTVTIKGLKLRKSWFAMGEEWIKLSDKGVAAGLNMEDEKDPYFVNALADYKNGYMIYKVGGEYTGAAIDPAKVVKLRRKLSSAPKVKKITLKNAIEQGLVKFDVTDYSAYVITGTMPYRITATSGNNGHTIYDHDLFNGYTVSLRIVKDGQSLGYAVMALSFKNNKKTGASATVKAKVIRSDILSGSAVVGSYTVDARSIEELPVYNENDPDIKYEAHGNVYAVIKDGQKGSGNLNKPNVKLYQACYNKAGRLRSVPLGTNRYVVHKGRDRGTKGIAADVYVTTGSKKDFIFADRYVTDEAGTKQGMPCGIYHLYDKKLSASDIDQILIDGIMCPVNKGVINEIYAPVFTGIPIFPRVDTIRIGDKTYRLNEDYTVEYVNGIAAGKKAGEIRITAIYNEEYDSYDLGGTVILKYDISTAPGVTL